MMRSVLSTTVLSSILLFVQSTWLKDGLFWGVVPDFALLVVLWVSYNNKSYEGSLAGFLSGIVCDSLSSSPIGYHAFILVAASYVVGLSKRIVIMDGFFIPVLAGFLGTIVKGFASLALLALFGGDRLSAYNLGDIHFWVEAAINGALAPLIFLGLSRARRFFITRRASE